MTQDNIRVAVDCALERLRCQTADQLVWLGAVPAGPAWRLPVLDDDLTVDPVSGRVTTSAGADAGAIWQVLVLHYLAVVSRPESRGPEITFADLPSGRGYAEVYHKRVIKRLCATAGRELATFCRAAACLRARQVEGGDAAFDFVVFPRLTIRLVWYAPDEEFPPLATLLLPSNIEQWFCTEDIAVLGESCVARLSGRPF